MGARQDAGREVADETTAEIVVVIHHDATDLSAVRRLAEAKGVALRVVRPFAGEPLPEPDAVSGLIVLGGPQSAYDPLPYLKDEMSFVADAVAGELPVLGICLGAQLLAHALGGAAVPGEHGLETGYIEVQAADGQPTGEQSAGEQSTAGQGERFAGTHFSFHTDTVVLPADAELLATSDRYPQAWRIGSALAVQYHPELSAAGVRRLLGIEGPKLAEFGIDVEAVLRESRAREEQVQRAGDQIIADWLDTGH